MLYTAYFMTVQVTCTVGMLSTCLYLVYVGVFAVHILNASGKFFFHNCTVLTYSRRVHITVQTTQKIYTET